MSGLAFMNCGLTIQVVFRSYLGTLGHPIYSVLILDIAAISFNKVNSPSLDDRAICHPRTKYDTLRTDSSLRRYPSVSITPGTDTKKSSIGGTLIWNSPMLESAADAITSGCHKMDVTNWRSQLDVTKLMSQNHNVVSTNYQQHDPNNKIPNPSGFNLALALRVQ